MAEPKELGTLIVVVGKARNLVNKSRFGKQDPFCTVTYGEDKQKTKAIKRGGQHPEWDEELRFTIMEDADDVLARSQSTSDSLAPGSSTTSISSISKSSDSPGVTTAQALAQRSRKGAIGKKGGKSMRLACYADDAKEPELIGDCTVLIDDVLKKGEVDEWYDILYKEKYSGEVYLELTFYSNDAPPVKRNVPRPSVHNYGGAGVFDPGPSTLPSHNRLSGSISHSGSVSGASLYIPPYVQPPAPSGTATPIPQLNPSSSFANLGLPPSHPSQQHLSSQPSYPPLSHTPQPVQTLSVDALTRPMSSMSLASSASGSRPLPPPTPVPGQSHLHHHSHRHSVGGPNEAPWGSLLPQSQPPPQPAPHPRPMSSNDAVPWQQAQRIEDERMNGGRTPVPRPVSGQGYRPPWQQQPMPAPASDPYRTVTPAPPVPSALQAGPVPPPKHQHANSFSGPSCPQNAPSHAYSSPASDPIPHPNSAPPTAPRNHYGLPASSFGGVAQSLLGTANSPQPDRYVPTPAPDAYYQPTPPRQDYPPQPQHDSTPTRQNSYPNIANGHQPYPPQPHRNSLPEPPMHQSPPPPTPPRDQYAPQQGYGSTSQSGYGYQQTQPAPAAGPSSAPPVAPGGYVPWYQQTQACAPTPQPQPDYGQAGPSYSSPPPPVPSHRPIPNPPAPPKTSSGGYYPSDELYVSQQQTQQPAQPPQSSWQQQAPPAPGYAQPPPNPNQAYDAPYGSQQSYVPAHTPTPAPAPHSPAPAQGYDRQPSPAPHVPPHRHSMSSLSGSSGAWQAQQPPPQQAYGRSPSPAPPTQPYYASQPAQPYRSPSPQPPVQQQPYMALPTQLAPPSGIDGGRSPSPSGTKQDWRTYMQSLSTTPVNAPSPANGANGTYDAVGVNGNGGGGISAQGGLNRSPSPQPPPKDWYTPPPNLPSSIRPPDGWRSSLPAEPQQGWRQ